MSFYISAGVITPPLTAGAVAYGTGSTALMNSAGTASQVLLSGGAGAPTWASVSTVVPQATATVLGTVYGSETTSGGTPFLTAYGYNAGAVNTGVNNTFMGVSAGLVNTSGTNNVAAGYQSLKANISGSSNTAVGVSALVAHTGTFGTAVGFEALKANTTGSQNTAMGYQSMLTNLSADQNTAYGSQSLKLNSTGTANVAIGYSALYNCTSPGTNVAVGHNAGVAITSGEHNAILGSSAGLVYNASYATLVGYLAGYQVTTGFSNTCIGAVAGTALTTGSRGIYIGESAGASSGGATNEMVMSGNGSVGKGTNTGFIYVGGGGNYQGNNSAAWSVTSDQRLKKNIVDNNDGLNKITAIQVRNFEYRTEDEVTELPIHSVIEKEGVQLGVIAQELFEVLPDCVRTESTGVMSVNSDNLTWYLVNAVKQLKAELDAYKEAHP